MSSYNSPVVVPGSPLNCDLNLHNRTRASSTQSVASTISDLSTQFVYQGSPVARYSISYCGSAPEPSTLRNASSRSQISLSMPVIQDIDHTQNPHSNSDQLSEHKEPTRMVQITPSKQIDSYDPITIPVESIDRTPNQLSALLVCGYCRECDLPISLPMDIMNVLWIYYYIKAPVFNVSIGPNTIQLFPPSYFKNTGIANDTEPCLNECINSCINSAVYRDQDGGDNNSSDDKDVERSLRIMLERADDPRCIQLLHNVEHQPNPSFDAIMKYSLDRNLKNVKIISFAIFPDMNIERSMGSVKWRNMYQNTHYLNQFADAVVVIDMGLMTQNYGDNQDDIVNSIEAGINDIASLCTTNPNIFYDLHSSVYASRDNGDTFLDNLYSEDLKLDEDECPQVQYLAYSRISACDEDMHSIMSDLTSKRSCFVDYDFDFDRTSNLSSIIVCNNMGQEVKDYMLQSHGNNDRFGNKCSMAWFDDKDLKSNKSVSMIVSDNEICRQYDENLNKFANRDHQMISR